MRTLINDLRYGARMLRRAPGFTVAAVLTLGLGIGANTAMFGVVDSLLFRPPSGVVDPGQLVRVRMQLPAPRGEPAELSGVLSYPQYVTLRDRATGFAGVAAYARASVTVGTADESRSQPALLVSGDYFRVLGVRAAVGRLITHEDDRDNAALPIIVLSWHYWQRELGGDVNVIGRPMRLNGRSFTVVGVAPKYFTGVEPGGPALWAPLGTAPMLGYDERVTRSRFASWLSIVARVAPRLTRAQAQATAQAAVLAARDAGDAYVGGPGGPGGPPGEALGDVPGGGEVRVAIEGPDQSGGRRAAAPPPPQVRLTGLGGRDEPAIPAAFGGERSVPISLWFLAVTAAVLLIACANVANLLLVRAANRANEMAVRLAIGATRGRLAGQLMTESLLLAALGAIAGVLLAFAGVSLLPRVMPLPPLPPFFDARLLAFTAVLTVATTALFGLAPALRVARSGLHATLGATARTHSARSVGRSALVVVQLGASLMLLIGAGLFVRSLRNVKAIETGFALDELLVVSADLRGARLTRERTAELWAGALSRVRALPGVRSASLGAGAPFEMVMMLPVGAPGRVAPDRRPMPAQADFVGAAYFATLGIPIREGRAFTDEDREGSTPVAIVNQTLARRIWGAASPIGQCMSAGMIGRDAPCLTVVGVAADARYAEITAAPAPFFYRPLTQRPRALPPMTVMHIRVDASRSDPAGMSALAAQVRREIQALDTGVPFVNVRPTADLIRPQMLPWRVGSTMFGLFGALGALLAAVGLAGVLSFAVAQRTRELGVRMALGAQRRDVLAVVLGEGARLVTIGVAVGLAAGAAATRFFASALYGVSPLDPAVYALTAAAMAAIGVIAMYIPARRATRVDPMVALRAE
ncbi:MAG: ABC transporter permease [Gemmatimonadaceae bacterium]